MTNLDSEFYKEYEKLKLYSKQLSLHKYRGFK